MSNISKKVQLSASKVPGPVMLEGYLSRGPTTTTERLIAQGGYIVTSIAATEKLCSMETYLNQLVKQAQGGDSLRGSTSSTLTS